MRNESTAKWISLAHALLVTIAAMIAGLVIPLAALLALAALDRLPGATGQLVLTVALTQGVAFGGVALIFLETRGLRTRPVAARVPGARELWTTVGAYFLALAGAITGALLAYLVGLEPAVNRLAELGMHDPQIFLLLIPLSFLLIGPGEELLFRGVVQGRLRESFGPTAAVILASVIFAAAHVFAVVGAPADRAVTVSILVLPSLVFGAVYERTRNIVVPALVHGAYNATLFWLAYLAARAGSVQAPPAGGSL